MLIALVRRYDWFAGARRGWKVDAEGRLKLVIAAHGDATPDYIRKRIAIAPWGTFERRRWGHIRRLADRQRRRMDPLTQP
jgi:hypothetical protein